MTNKRLERDIPDYGKFRQEIRNVLSYPEDEVRYEVIGVLDHEIGSIVYSGMFSMLWYGSPER